MATILYFASIRDAVGIGEENVVIPGDVTTVAELASFLAMQGEGHAVAFADREKLRCAVDLAMVGFDAPIAGAKEIAFFPPVTGG